MPSCGRLLQKVSEQKFVEGLLPIFVSSVAIIIVVWCRLWNKRPLPLRSCFWFVFCFVFFFLCWRCRHLNNTIQLWTYNLNTHTHIYIQQNQTKANNVNNKNKKVTIIIKIFKWHLINNKYVRNIPMFELKHCVCLCKCVLDNTQTLELL